MAIPEDKMRVGITLSKALVARLDAYCERTGMTRSAFISYALSHQLDTEAQAMSYVQSAIGELFQQLAQKEGLTLGIQG